MEWSKYQLGYFEAMQQGGNNFLAAVAGSGKTTAVAEAANRSGRKRILACSFGRDTTQQLGEKMPERVVAKTLNQLGWAAVRDSLPFVRFDEKKLDKLYYALGTQVPLFKVKRLVDICKANVNQNVAEMNEAYGVLADDETVGVAAKVLSMSIQQTDTADYTDQYYFPVHYGFPLPPFEEVYVDEAQDLSYAQMLLLKQIVGDPLMSFVGDEHQAIYFFRGADARAVATLKTMFGCHDLPLSICYRCPKGAVELAKKYVPHIEAWEGAKDGIVKEMTYGEVLPELRAGDLVLNRTNAPLVRMCLTLIKEGRRAYVKGKEIAEAIAFLIRSFETTKVSQMLLELERWLEQQRERLVERPEILAQREDMADVVKVLAEGCRHVDEVTERLNNAFQMKRDSIVLMTIHKSKGLEARRVVITDYSKLPSKRAETEEQVVQEKNLVYVALTRTKHELILVG